MKHQLTIPVEPDSCLMPQVKLLACIVESSGDAIFSITNEGVIVTWNRSAESLYGYAAREAVGIECAALLWPEEGLEEEVRLRRRLTRGECISDFETTLVHNNGESIRVNLTLSPLNGADGAFLGASVIARGAGDNEARTLRGQAMQTLEAVHRMALHQQDELETLNARLETTATTDSLTGLKNRRILEEQLEFECRRSARYQTPLSLLLVDIDRFRWYSETYGQAEGDKVIRQVAEILLEEPRTTDLAARYSEEQFCVLLTNTDREGAMVTAERIRAQIEAICEAHGDITVSVGVATFSQTMEKGDDLLIEAHKALYVSKQDGCNRVTHFEDNCDIAFPTNWAVALKRTQGTTEVKVSGEGAATVDASVLHVSKKELVHAYDSMIGSWSRVLELRDREAEGHSKRVMEMTVQLAQMMGVRGQELVYMRWGALLHDIGKMGMPDSILLTPAPLTPEEWDVMRTHTTLAYEMLSSIAFMHPALDIPFSHHERWDGTGYPQGLKEEEIPLAARIFAVVDVWDVLRSNRPYRKAWSERAAQEYIFSLSGKHFDPQVVHVFHQMLTADNQAAGSLEKRAA